MSLQNDVYTKLKRAIIYGELGPGEKLSESELATRLNSSRTPVREALKQLQIEGYVTVAPNRGAFVSKLAREEIEHTYGVLELLEGYAAELAAKNIRQTELAELKGIQRKMALYVSRRKFRDYMEENGKFHDIIARGSRNHCLLRTITELRSRVYRYHLMSIAVPAYLERYVSDHGRIADSLVHQDSGEARRRMKQHVNFVKRVLIRFLKEGVAF